jgi:CHAT domain-containing protein
MERLTVSEILEMNLSAKFSRSSRACDYEQRSGTSGEGLLSLAWAFLASGASNVVAAQWAVEEKATADLMSNFYRILNKEPNSPATALREAQLISVQLPAPYNHPFYWSAFVLTGNPR